MKELIHDIHLNQRKTYLRQVKRLLRETGETDHPLLSRGRGRPKRDSTNGPTTRVSDRMGRKGKKDLDSSTASRMGPVMGSQLMVPSMAAYGSSLSFPTSAGGMSDENSYQMGFDSGFQRAMISVGNFGLADGQPLKRAKPTAH